MRRRYILPAAALVALAVVGTAGALSIRNNSVPDAHGVFWACVHPTGGALTMLGSSSSNCPSGQVKVHWSGVSTAFALVRGPNVNVAPDTEGTSSALCSTGSSPVGGGYFVTNGGPPQVYGSTVDTANGTTTDGWDVAIRNPGGTTLTFHAWGICVNQTIRLPG